MNMMQGMNAGVTNVSQIVLSAIKDMNRDLQLEQLRDADDTTALYCDDSDLDSLSLVLLVGEIEARINDAFDSDIVIASEKALSLRNSPFRSVGALITYIDEELAAK